jgi:arylsulfatase A-like enzyme
MMALMGSEDRGDMGGEHNKQVSRRTFLKGGLVAGGVLAGAGFAIRAAANATGDGDAATATDRSSVARAGASPSQARPNILVIVVDQLRYPQWLSPAGFHRGLPPNLARLSAGAVSFQRHYTVSNDCSPSRSALLTGLYTHQTGCMITGGSTLDPGFPTWGTMLRDHGYQTRWYGKWHLTHHDNRWSVRTGEPALERYGFSGGTFPSPDGAPGQGWRIDPHVARQFADWYAADGGSEPWCTTVSFVNPHDIAWWYVWSDRVAAEAAATRVVGRLPPNYETPELMIERRKPRLQRSLQATAASSFGPVPFHGTDSERRWLQFMNLYAKLQMQVDRHVGEVLETLASRPEIAANTVIVFTSDHGEYGSSHGLRGKGGGAYEEAIRVPLIVKDPRGKLTASPEAPRTQMTSSVDVAPLLLTIASGSQAWRRERRYTQLARRLDLTSILADPSAAGRPYVLHATDEVVTEFAVEPYAADAPLHVTAIRTPQAKYATYAHWEPQTVRPLAFGAEAELYDYSSHAGRLELDNGAGHSPLQETLHRQLEGAIANELREPLPPALGAAQRRGFADYFSTARRAAKGAAAMRKQRTERLVGPLQPGDTGEGRHN